MHHPNQLRIKGFARSTLFRFEVRVLELNHPTITGPHVCDVSFTVSGNVNDLLPISGKLVFPSSVPLRFILPPRIAKETPFVSPVPKANLSALCNHGSFADRTYA